jgi:hypothetical protein
MGSEGDTLFGNAPQLAVAKYLKSTAVGEHRAIPGDEPMQSTQVVNELMPGPKIEVVGISKDDLSAQCLKFLLGYCFDRTRSPDWHKHRG